MCTAIAMRQEGLYFGRNMDWHTGFGEQVVVTPRRYPLPFRKSGVLSTHFAMIGMAAVMEGYPLYADAVNEKGLCMAGLHFPQSACYSPEIWQDMDNISPFELIPWVLGQCADIGEARCLLERTQLVAIPFRSDVPLTPLHWMLADETQSLVVEVTAAGMQVLENPADVLTNEPPLPYQLQHLAQYLNLTPDTPANAFSERVGIQPFGKGLGSFGLPGDPSSTSRFVKAAWLLQCSQCGKQARHCIAQCFHILEAVSVVQGCIRLPDGSPYRTRYSTCIHAGKAIYSYRTYENSCPRTLTLTPLLAEGRELVML